MSDGDCSYQSIIASADACKYALDNCDGSYINFYAMHYCTFNGYLWISLPVLSLLILICFYLTGSTANKYLSCALTALSDRLKISQNLAGVTFLAFGNGAPDVISSIVAAGSNSNGLELSIGALQGAGIFVTSFVSASVIWFAGTVKVNKVLYTRDIILYILSIIVLSIFSFDGKIVLWEAICFLMIYIMRYVIVAIIQDRYYKNKEKGNYKFEESPEDKIDEAILNNIIHFDEHGNITKKIKNINENSEKLKLQEEDLHKQNSNMTIFYKSMIQNEKFKDNLYIPVESEKKLFEFNINTLKYRLKKLYFHTKETKLENLNFFNKIIFWVIDMPFNLLRDLTIPACEIDCWNQLFFVFMPATCLIFVVLITKTWNVFFESLLLTIITPIFVVLLVLLFKYTTYRNRLPSFFITLCIFAFVMSVFWIWFISQFLVDILNTIGVIINFPTVFLAMTILAFGNSVPDLSLNVALASQGYGEMGIAGSVAGPLFNLLIGLGTTLIQNTISNSFIEFHLYTQENILLTICTIALAFNLVRLLIHASILRFNLNKSISVLGFVIYIAFFVLICIYSFI